MTLHLFYRIYKGFTQDKLPLYAYTDDDEYAEKFIAQRNMDVFYYRKEKITKDRMKELEQKYRNRRLSYGTFLTRNDNPLALRKTKKVQVLCTWEEEESVISNTERFWKENKRMLMDCSMLKDKYILMLTKLLYIDFYIFYVERELCLKSSFYEPYVYSNYGPSNIFVEEMDCTGLGKKFVYDDFQVFLHFFQDVFAKKKKDDSA